MPDYRTRRRGGRRGRYYKEGRAILERREGERGELCKNSLRAQSILDETFGNASCEGRILALLNRKEGFGLFVLGTIQGVDDSHPQSRQVFADHPSYGKLVRDTLAFVLPFCRGGRDEPVRFEIKKTEAGLSVGIFGLTVEETKRVRSNIFLHFGRTIVKENGHRDQLLIEVSPDWFC